MRFQLAKLASPEKRFRPLTWDVIIIVLLVVLLITGSLINPAFLTAFNFSLMLPNIGEILLIAMPMTLLIIAGEIDLSVASIVGLSGVIFGLTYQNGLNIWLAAFLGVIVGVLCGAVNGILVARIGLGSLAVTIATLALYRGFATAAMGNKSVTDFPESWTNFGYSTIGDTFLPQTYPIIILFLLIFGVLTHLSIFGRRTFAIGQNVEAARFAAISVLNHKTILFMLTGAMSGVAGVIYVLRISTAQYDNAMGLELSVIATVLLGGVSIFGGVGTIWGVAAAAVLFGSLEALFNLQAISPNIFTIVTGSILIGSVMIPLLLGRINFRRIERSRMSKSEAGQL